MLPCWPAWVEVDARGKMPDVALRDTERNWLLLAESVTHHGPVDGKRGMPGCPAYSPARRPDWST